MAAATTLALAALTGCTSGSAPDHPDGPRPAKVDLTWVADQTLPDVSPGGIATDPTTGTTYVGGSLPAAAASSYSGPLIKGGTRKPVLWVRRPDGGWQQARLLVTSFYGAQATLAALSAYGRVMALGAVAGGAHANPRPSFFAGTLERVAEREQGFYVYGGENAVGIVSMAAGPKTLLMVGQWAPDGHRASGALWTSPDGTRYVRHDQIPGLGDSQNGQRTTSPQAAAAIGDRFVIVGSVTDLSRPKLSIAPAVWLSDGTSVSPGTLPAPATKLGGPSAIACAPTAGEPSAGTCLTAGLLTAAGAQAMSAWRVDVTGSATGVPLDLQDCPAPAPAPDPGESTPRPPRVRVSVSSDGRGWIVASTSRSGIACRVDGASVRAVTVPAGCLPVAVQAPPTGTATAGTAGRAELICADGHGVTTYRQG
jgi:hypothetical protein